MSSEIEVGERDAGLILRGDGVVTIIQPKATKEDGNVLDQSFLAFALGMLVAHPDFADDCTALLDKAGALAERQLAVIEAAEATSVANEATPGE